MSIEIARYQFHSWARRGIAGSIREADDLGAETAASIERAEVAIGVDLNGTGLSKQCALIGPGDIVGVHREMTVRTEPLNCISDFEANYLAFIEFYDEDFLWRYTPAAPVGTRLRPWLFLLVLKEDEFERSTRRVPLPSITVKDKAVFPPANETWLWAHVHSNADIPDAELSDFEKFLLSLNRTVNDDPDQLYCRLISPRKLEPHTHYCAFIIPAFESGRLAGLEQPTNTVLAQLASWTADGARGELPFYHEWYFRTGSNADFESLVRDLQPRAMPAEVGIRDMDCHRPGFIRADGSAELPGASPSLIGLEGAIRSPATQATVFPNPANERSFQQELQSSVNLPFEIIAADDASDPIISLPLYGGKHAQKSVSDVPKLNIDANGWLHELNKDPRWRSGAGFGTAVVQKDQEAFMRKAWAQAKSVLDANAQIKRTHFYLQVAAQLDKKTLQALPQAQLVALTKPLLSKVLASPTTLVHQLRESRLPVAVFSGSFRRLLRPRGGVARRLGRTGVFDYSDLVQRTNTGNISAAEPRGLPQGLPNTETIAKQIAPKLPAWLLRRYGLLAVLGCLLALLLGLLADSWLLTAVLGAAVAALAARARRLSADLDAADALEQPGLLGTMIVTAPPQPSFSLRLSDEASAPEPTRTTAGADSVEAAHFRNAARDLSKRLAISVAQPVLTAFDLEHAHARLSASVDPRRAFPSRLVRQVKVPSYVPLHEPEQIFEAMAYPDFEEATYKQLCALSEELLLPNLKAVPINTITLLKTNQRFIESYLLGLNHEMGRELLWREYPTDERGSYFRQFWDVNGLIRPQQNRSAAELAEQAKDIDPIHTWQSASALGAHNKRAAAGAGDQTVLLIRGDLLKRYPNTLIFAQKAIAGPTVEEPLIDADLTTEEFATQVKFPLFKAELPPDIKLFGFDLTIEQARGTALSPGFSDHLGWFFLIQEVPGEPRFGMDVSFNPGTDGLSWDDLAWDRLPSETRFVTSSVIPNLNVADKSRWGTDAANMAYVLFQKPNMIAVHASEMLEQLTDQAP